MAAYSSASGKESNVNIRKATPDDLPALEAIFAQAREYMCRNGNPNQWVDGYPQKKIIRNDIAQGACHICEENGKILGVFSYFPGPDPTYAYIEDGSWPDEKPYGVIHRIAAGIRRKGVASFCYDYALAQCPVLRIDTHKDNVPMQNSLKKNGFTRCGIIYLENGEPRVAFYKHA